ncbi:MULTISPECIES: sporulation protein YqfC [Bacillaceae]|uniref:Sporulation protein YqfC n=1 Tax=Evansella alkalicola TaxID=745819 RepID=A0ABS6JZ64_9BACI|nr:MULTISPECIES: sporulation protein YqfC [Bacillaceae]MBU9722502.1 sporulation protein YqfC [Bacillus alkalicola]
MKRLKKTIRQWMTEQMDLPADVMMDLPRVTLIGNFHIYIENHKGLIRFTQEELRLRLTEGELLVVGRDFVIKNILPEEILLEGVIVDIRFIKEGS